MTLSNVDWIIIVVFLLVSVAAGMWARRYVRDVDDFAVAGREMDVQLGVASLAATEIGIVTVMYTAEMGFKHGLAGATPGVLLCLAMYIVGKTGFIIEPMRNAGVLTIPELFEKRFGRCVRWLAGLVVVLGGVLNMGIFLRLAGEFVMHIAGADPMTTVTLSLMGSEFHFGMLEISMTLLLALVLIYTILGGMISVLVTNYLQFLVMCLGIVMTSALVFRHIGPRDLIIGLERSHGSAVAVTMTDPFNPAASLGWSWIAWQAMIAVSAMTTWQPIVTRVLAARNSQTAQRIYQGTSFYFVGRFTLPGLWGAAAFLYFCIPATGGLPDGIDSLSAMPVYLSRILPAGIIGVMLAAMLAAEMSTESGYLLTWATVIYNDLVNPCLRRPMSSRVQLQTIRLLVLAIGIFLLFYGLWYEIPGRAWDYLSLTGNIYLASLFALLVGALYWKRANSCGALAAIILGAVGPITFLVVNAIVKDPVRQIPAEYAGLAAFAMSFAGMIGGSLLKQSADSAGNRGRKTRI